MNNELNMISECGDYIDERNTVNGVWYVSESGYSEEDEDYLFCWPFELTEEKFDELTAIYRLGLGRGYASGAGMKIKRCAG